MDHRWLDEGPLPSLQRDLRSNTGRHTEKERVLLVHVKNKTKQDSICIMAYLSMKNGDHLIDIGRRQTWKRTREC